MAAHTQTTADVVVTASQPAASQFVSVAPSEANSPLLRSSLSLDLADVPLRDALREISRQMGGHLMYDEGVASIKKRVTIKDNRIEAGDALRQVLEHVPVKAYISKDGRLVLLKTVRDAAPRDSGSVRGHVVDSTTGAPIQRASVELDGTKSRVLTGDDGSFRMANVPAGSYTISVHRLGYKPARRSIVLRAEQDTTVLIALASVPSTLKEVVTTGSGEQQRMEIGNSVVVVNVDSIMATTPVSTVSDLLAFRVPGLLAQHGSGAVGAPTRLRIRGNGSIESDNAPIIIVDGIRIMNDAKTAESNSLYAGVIGGSGSNDLSSRLDDIDPNSIASIEVMRGPAASTLYGSEAANGVIIIKTKQGHDGPPRWSAYADRQFLVQTKDYEYPVMQLGGPLGGGGYFVPNCNLVGISNGSCIPDEGNVVGFNMLRDPRFTPQTSGYTQSFGANVTGGNGGLQYFLGGTYLDQLGTAKLPEVNQEIIVAGRGGKPLPEEIIRPNARNNASVNARITGTFQGNSHFALGASFISQYQRVGNDGMSGLLAAARSPSDTTPVEGWKNWYGTREERVKHVLGNASLNWQPHWFGGDVFSASVTYGWDYSMNDDQYYAPRGSCEPLCEGTNDQGYLGYINAGRRTNYAQTLTAGGSVSLPVTSWMSSHTRFGANYAKTKMYSLYGHNDNLGVGRGFYTARGNDFISDIGDERATAGWYLEEQVNLRHDRLFLTAGLRQDAGSAFGDAAVQPVYLKWNASYVVSEEPFFAPFRAYVPMLRLRFATGNAGIMPASTARLRTYAMQGNFVDDNGDPVGGFAELSGPGNPDLRAEHSREYEGGFDADLFQQRLTLNFTWYRKYTWDAINRGPVAGSAGAAVVRAFRGNVGDVLNKGFEAGATARILDRDDFQYSVSGTISRNTNELTRMAPGQISFISLNASGDLYTGNYAKVVEGYPLFGRWSYPILGWADQNGNGMIDPTEVRVGDSLTYVGPSQPKYTAYMSHHLGLFRGRVAVDANFAYSGGMTQFNYARKSILSHLSPGQGPSSFEQQACIVAGFPSGQRHATDWCFMETVKALRFQNLSVGFMLPPSLVQHVGISAATLRFSATNLALWSNYHGIDPGINTDPVNGNGVQAGAAFPAPRSYGVRLQVQF
ncbi:MAG TPA: carboxypeptidase regulatory-like domain-containing protein [Gemmatimonadaceae bacterium]|nr:carboxypeptidase regulatory-like domain-containing protein [Gemmatimonadaceae bacterium]